MDVLNDPPAGAGQVAEVISQDTALTVRLLRLDNSALFAFGRPIETVGHAVNLVGTSQVRDLALATSVRTIFVDVPPELIHAGVGRFGSSQRDFADQKAGGGDAYLESRGLGHVDVGGRAVLGIHQ